ncbi:UNVERIFIED_CONTAM: hypothetical protein FKN15_029195 [Acipenser sinensis]
MNTRCPPKRVPSAARFFTLCRLPMQPPKSYSVGGQRSSGQLTGKPSGARPDYSGRSSWLNCVVYLMYPSFQIGKKSVKAVLWVSADGLRVVDDKTKDLILDQTIEKVSFCAPDRNYDKAFSYICRDGTTRRWICHCFMALKDSGERLSHAVGCAFAACLERKQKREKECGVTASFDASRTSFVREGSFRVTSATQQAEREEVMKQLQDRKKAESPSLPADSASPPEGAASPVDRTEAGYQHAIPRRHAPIEQLVRQGSFRGFPALSQKNSPFKRQLSVRLNELPSTLQRKTDFQAKNPGKCPSH